MIASHLSIARSLSKKKKWWPSLRRKMSALKKVGGKKKDVVFVHEPSLQQSLLLSSAPITWGVMEAWEGFFFCIHLVWVTAETTRSSAEHEWLTHSMILSLGVFFSPFFLAAVNQNALNDAWCVGDNRSTCVLEVEGGEKKSLWMEETHKPPSPFEFLSLCL